MIEIVRIILLKLNLSGNQHRILIRMTNLCGFFWKNRFEIESRLPLLRDTDWREKYTNIFNKKG